MEAARSATEHPSPPSRGRGLGGWLQERFIRWALRVRPPEPAPVILTQRRVYVLPTRAGVGYAASLVVMLLGAMNYNLSLGYALTFLLAGLGVTAILHTFRNLAHLSLAPGRVEPVFAGDNARFTLLLHNARADERRQVQVRLVGGMPEILDVPARSSAAARLAVPATARGWLSLPRVTLDTHWPLGLIRAWAYAVPDMRCLVYPRPANATVPPPPTFGGHAGDAARNPSGSEDFLALRGHQLADPPRHVAWKTAARLGADAPLMTKQYADPAAQTVWLDWDVLPAAMPVEERLSWLTRWVLDAHAAGLSWGLRLPAAQLAPAGGDAHLHTCLRRLALHPSAEPPQGGRAPPVGGSEPGLRAWGAGNGKE